MRLIDSISLKNAVNAYANEPVKLNDRRWGIKCKAIIADMIGIIEEAPTVDAAPVKHGKWFDAMVGELPVQVCDQCSTFFPLAYTGGGHHYCPNCGAKMDLQEEQDGTDNP